MEPDGISPLTRVVEAEIHLQKAQEGLETERPELAVLLSQSLADVTEVRQRLRAESATTRWYDQRREVIKSK